MNLERTLIAVDLDGTALSDLYSLNRDTLRALQSAKDRGHVVMIATARPSCMTLLHYHEIGLNTPMCLLNGAYLYNPVDESFGKIERLIPSRDIESLLEILADFDVKSTWIENDDDLYVKGWLELKGYFKELLLRSNVHQVSRLPRSATGRVFVFLDNQIDALGIQNKASKLKTISSRIRLRPDGSSVLSFHSVYSDKWYSVQATADYYQIPNENIIVFGDEENDRLMIESATYGFIMKNGYEFFCTTQNIDITKVTEKSNLDGGVGHTLNSMLDLNLFGTIAHSIT